MHSRELPGEPRTRDSARPGSPGVVCVLPLGSTEQHGPHLPADTDTRIATAAAFDVAAMLPGATLLPPLAFGASGEHQGFSGTASIGTDALADVLVELGRSVGEWSERLLIVNGHGGNLDALRRSVALLRVEGRDAAWLACRTAEDSRDTHAGHAETSILLHLDPAAVSMPLAEPGCLRPLNELLPELRAHGVAALSPNGVLGDPTTATAEEGQRLWRALLVDARDRVSRWSPDEHGMLR